MYTNYAPQPMQDQGQAPQMAPQNMGYQQQLAQALRGQGMASPQSPDTGGMEGMMQQMAMQKLMAAKTPGGMPPAGMSPAGASAQPMLSQYGSMLG